MIRIQLGADLEDLWGGQTDFEVAVLMTDNYEDVEIVGAGHTVAEAVADARATFRTWRQTADEDAMIAERAEADRIAEERGR